MFAFPRFGATAVHAALVPVPTLEREEYERREIDRWRPTLGPIVTTPTVTTLPSGATHCAACSVSWQGDGPCWSCHPDAA